MRLLHSSRSGYRTAAVAAAARLLATCDGELHSGIGIRRCVRLNAPTPSDVGGLKQARINLLPDGGREAHAMRLSCLEAGASCHTCALLLRGMGITIHK